MENSDALVGVILQFLYRCLGRGLLDFVEGSISKFIWRRRYADQFWKRFLRAVGRARFDEDDFKAIQEKEEEERKRAEEEEEGVIP